MVFLFVCTAFAKNGFLTILLVIFNLKPFPKSTIISN